MKRHHQAQPHASSDDKGRSSHLTPRTVGTTLLHVASSCGFGLWLLLGLALSVGVYPAGRGDALVPLALGAVLVGAGLLAACAHAPWMPTWHGWRIGKSARPTRDALIALATVLPVLAVGGLARGDNSFWATRIAGAALALCSLTSLIVTAHGDAIRRVPGLDANLAMQLPLSRVISASFGGGLWLWLCAAGQDRGGYGGQWILIVGLLGMTLLRGLIENLRWQAVLQRLPGPRPLLELQPRRYLAAVLVYAVPCVALLLASFHAAELLVAAVAAVSCIMGMAIELSLYDDALAALPDHR